LVGRQLRLNFLKDLNWGRIREAVSEKFENYIFCKEKPFIKNGYALRVFFVLGAYLLV